MATEKWVVIEILKACEQGAVGDQLRCTEESATELIDQGVAKKVRDVKAHTGPSGVPSQSYGDGRAEPDELYSMVKEVLDGKIAAAVAKAAEEEKKTRRPAPEKRWKNLADFALAVRKAGTPNEGIDQRLIPASDDQKSVSGLGATSTNGEGYLLPPEYMEEVLRNIWDKSELMSRCRRIPVSAQSILWPAINEVSRADGYRWGGVRGYWMAEAAQVTASKPSFQNIRLEPHRLAALCYVTQDMLDLSPVSLEPLLRDLFALELAWLVDEAIMWGLGAGQPLGYMKSPCLITGTKVGSQTATTIRTENVQDMWIRLVARSRANAVWFVNQDCEAQLMRMSAGGVTTSTGAYPNVLVYMPPNGLAAAPYATMFGRPVIASEHAQTLGTVGDITLADLSQYLLAEGGGGMESNVSIHLRFDYYESAFRFSLRVDGQPWWRSAITPAKGSSTLSPFVAMETRS